MRRRYVTVDVFTDRMFGGNPLAVVLDAEGLSGGQMQAIAREFAYSETSFVLPPREAQHTAWVRIFTPRAELPFAGHPNVGTAFVLARDPRIAALSAGQFLFEEAAGLVPVGLLREGGAVVGAELTAPQGLTRAGRMAPAAAASCLSLAPEDVRTDRHLPEVVSVGLAVLVVEIASREALRRAAPDLARFRAALPRDGAGAIYLYTAAVDGAEAPCTVQARMFAPLDGILEDPATGSATAAMAALQAALHPEPDADLALRVGQGFDMGRPSLLSARVRKRRGSVEDVRVGGRCVEVCQGSFALTGEEAG